MITFIDNLNIFALHKSGIISRIKNKLATVFYIVDIRFFAFYVRLKITQDWKKRIIKLSQLRYIKKLLDCHSILKAKTTKVPMRKIALFLLDILILDLEKAKYSTKIGSIIYAIVKTQIDITFVTFMVSRFAKNSSSEHFNAIDQILYYLTESCKRDIIFKREKKLKLVGYSDSN